MEREDAPAPPVYSGASIAGFFDEYGEREWDRLDRTVADRVSLALHRRYLARFIQPGDHVLEIGAGPGRFTIELARLGARITVADISAAQIELNRGKVKAAGLDEAVVERAVVDIVDLGRYGNAAFDATVSYGGPLSYVLERADTAVAELVRVTKPEGHLLTSVMSLVGAARAHLAGVLGLVERFGLDAVDREMRTGALAAQTTNGQPMKLYRWSELESLLRRHRCQIVAVSASNFISVGNEEVLSRALGDERLAAQFMEWETRACGEPGALDGGTHIIAVARTATPTTSR